MDRTLPGNAETTSDAAPVRWTAAKVYESYADFVWASLSRLGVVPDDLPDQTQEVFIVVHRRLDSFDGTSRMTTWLFGICLHVAQNWRRHRRRHPESPAEVIEREGFDASPEEQASDAQARRLLARILDTLEPARRAVFVMFELEGLSCVEISEMLGVPVGTVYSRLHTARASFQESVARVRRSQEVRR